MISHKAPVQSVDRAINILELLSRQGPSSVTQLALELEVHKSTAYRLLATLAGRNLVEQDDTEKYYLGKGLAELASTIFEDPDILEASRPVCQYLSGQVGETVTVSILEGDQATVIHQTTPPCNVLTVDWSGTRAPLHTTAAGKVLLAYLPSGKRRKLLCDPLETKTKQSLENKGEVERELLEVWEQGFGLSMAELEPGLNAVAAPIKDSRGRVVAALSVSGPESRLVEDRLKSLGTQTAVAADEISFSLGFR
jgi:DNA-binding IclR family transcriptional regulator